MWDIIHTLDPDVGIDSVERADTITRKWINTQAHVGDHDDAFLELHLDPRRRHLGKRFSIDDSEKWFVNEGDVFGFPSVIVPGDTVNPIYERVAFNGALEW